MVVLSDKTDYGSFAEPSSSGILISDSTGGITTNSSGQQHNGVNVQSNSNNSRQSSLNSNSNSLSSSVRSVVVGSDTFNSGGGEGNIPINNSNNNTRVGTSGPQQISPNPNVHFGLGLELGLGINKTVPSSTLETQKGVVDDKSQGAKKRATTNRLRNTSGNNNTLASSSQPTLRLSPTDTIVIVNNNNGRQTSNGNGTTIQPYSNSSSRSSPMSTNSGDLLYQRQPLLQECDNGWIDQDIDVGNELDSPMSIGDGKRGRAAVRIDIPSDLSVVTLKRYPKEKRKTVIAFLVLCCNFILATLSLALTHERLPDRATYKPLPDIILDNVTAQDWALYVSDILVALSVMVTAVVMLLHRHRWIVFRRAFLILACLYLMRSVTIYVTVLPVASYTYHCSPKSNTTSVLEVARRVIQLVSGFGLAINGQHTYCGDYIYSGHTVILVTAFLFIQEYTPRKLALLHWTSWLISCIGVVMMLISRGHYTVDVLIAYYVATRLFWMYHTLANNPQLKIQNGQNGLTTNFLSRIWWFPVFRYMEGNVGGTLPRQYSLPWSSKEHRPRRSI